MSMNNNVDPNLGEDAVHALRDTAFGTYAIRRKYKKSKLKRSRKKEAKAKAEEYICTRRELNGKHKLYKKYVQKRYQKEYYRALKLGVGQEMALQRAGLAASGLGGRVRVRALELAVQSKSWLKYLMILVVAFLILSSQFVSCGSILSAVGNTVLSVTYLSEPDDLDAAELYMTELEHGLQNRIDQIEDTYPGYDEYDYNLATIGHNPFTLINYLSAEHTRFSFLDVKSEIEALFQSMYQLSCTPVTETRTREVEVFAEDGSPVLDGEGNPLMNEESYEVKIMRVQLTTRSLESIVEANMTEGQKSYYDIYQESKGMLQQFASPVKYYWYLYVTSYYGYRTSADITRSEIHRGIDIGIPEGTEIYAGMDATVTTVDYNSKYGNYIVIRNTDGYVLKYAHLKTVSVTAGDAVTVGQIIGYSGSTGSCTGSELHMECLYQGDYYNPIFYVNAGTETLHGEEATGTGSNYDLSSGNSSGGGNGAGSTLAPDAYSDPEVQKLMEEAVKYLGYPYVWGGSTPSTSFDCSGFVSWVFNASGVHPMSRDTAQGIYNSCVVVSPSEAKAGDLIFFTGTYKSAGPVSHIGIYCGDGIMIHAGDPIQYANIHASYYASHFYAFGRFR